MSHLDPDRIAGLAAVGQDDPERRDADAHAADCEACRRELEGARRALSLLDSVEMSPPTHDALSRASHAVLAEMDAEATRATGRRSAPAKWRAWVPAGATAVAWAVSIALAKYRDDSGLLLSSLGAVAAAAGALASFRDSRLAATLLVLASITIALAIGDGGTLWPSLGVLCSLHELATAFVPLAAAALIARSRRIEPSAAGFATAATAGAVAGQAALHLTCPAAHSMSHLLVFHVGGVLLAAIAGAALSHLRAFRAPA